MSNVTTCRACDGEGVIHTGIDESPTTICGKCDGAGDIPLAAPSVANGAPAGELPDLAAFGEQYTQGYAVGHADGYASCQRRLEKDERLSFEEWAVREDGGNWDADDELFTRGGGGEYNHVGIRNEWNAWKARAAIAALPKPVVAMTDDTIYNFWINRDCMEAIRAGDMRGQFISATRAILAAAGPDALLSALRGCVDAISEVDDPDGKLLDAESLAKSALAAHAGQGAKT